MTNLKENLLVNRIIALIVGGLLVFAIMSFTVVKTQEKENAQLVAALEVSEYEAGRLLSDAKAQVESKNYEEAKVILNKLFSKQPGSQEAVEGKALIISIDETQAIAQTMWEEALPEIKEQWYLDLAAELLAKSDKERADLETNLEKTIDQAWDKEKSKVQENWENTNS